MSASSAMLDIIEYEKLDSHKFLLFKLNNEYYATPLLAVKQVVEYQNIKFVPNTAPYFLGLINYRGQIMGLVDLKKRFHMPDLPTGQKTFLIFESESGPIAAQVDHVEAVISIDDEKIEKKPNIRTDVPVHYMIGVVQYNDDMITVIDLNKSFSSEDYVEIHSTKLMTG